MRDTILCIASHAFMKQAGTRCSHTRHMKTGLLLSISEWQQQEPGTWHNGRLPLQETVVRVGIDREWQEMLSKDDWMSGNEASSCCRVSVLLSLSLCSHPASFLCFLPESLSHDGRNGSNISVTSGYYGSQWEMK